MSTESCLRPLMNLDILYEIVGEVARFDNKQNREILQSLALVCKTFNESIRPLLFSRVHWPHPNKHDAETGLLFFPEVLWPYFRYFHLDWPDHWPDSTPPRWGEKRLRIYYPKHLDKLEDALPQMTNIHTFQITCPFFPRTKLIYTIGICSNIKDLRITDTPFHAAVLPVLPATLSIEHLTIVAVGEAVRVGEGPYDKRYQSISYFMRGYRKQEASVGSRLAGFQRSIHVLCRPQILRYLQLPASYLVSTQLCEPWPCLHTLVLTGPPPATFYNIAGLVSRMPLLRDLRVLLSTTKAGGTQANLPFNLIGLYGEASEDLGAYAQLTSLALSNAYDTVGVLCYMPTLRRLAVCAVISPPRMPIALRRAEVEALLADLQAGGGNQNLTQIRLISEEDLDAGFLARLGKICPKLEIVEVERCGYQEAGHAAEWADYGDAFSAYQHLRELRVAMPFLGCEEPEHDHSKIDNNLACVRTLRKLCAEYLASRIPTLQRIGFEYRAHTMQRYEDRWLDFDIVRLGGAVARVVEQGPSWYQFPNVWQPVPLQE